MTPGWLCVLLLALRGSQLHAHDPSGELLDPEDTVEFRSLSVVRVTIDGPNH